MALTSVLRKVMLLADEVWSGLKQMEDVYFEDRSDQSLGVQLRYRSGSG